MRYREQFLAATLTLLLPGCVGKTLLATPTGNTQAQPQVQTPAKIQPMGFLRVSVRWPQKYYSQAIPLSTNAFELKVYDASGSVMAETLLQLGQLSGELRMVPGNNYRLDVKAFRNYGQSDQALVATAEAAGINILPAKITKPPALSLHPLNIPKVTALGSNIAQRGQTLTILGDGFIQSPVEVGFNGATMSVIPNSSTSLTVPVPATAFTGDVKVVADGIKSESSAYLWVLDSLSINAATHSLLVGQTLSFVASPSWFVMETPPILAPMATWESTNPAIASIDTTGLLTALAVGSTDVKGKLGITASAPWTIGVAAAPTVNSLSHPVARPGDTITLTGSGFSNPMEVEFNGATTSVAASDTTCTVQIPSTAYTGFIRVRAGGVWSTTSPQPLWLMSANPTITAAKALWDTSSSDFANILYGHSLKIAYSPNWRLRSGETPSIYGTPPAPLPCQLRSFETDPLHTVQPGTLDATISALPQTYHTQFSIMYEEPVPGRQSNAITVNSIPCWSEIVAGNGIQGTADGVGTAATFNKPWGLALGPNNVLYIADSLNHRIRKMDLATRAVSTFAGGGAAGTQDGTGLNAGFNLPTGLTIDPMGNLYVADQSNHRIRKVTAGGVVTTWAGNGYASYLDSTGTMASFNSPKGVFADPAGNVLVAEQYNHRIRKIDPAGAVTTIAGSGAADKADGEALSLACFKQPGAIAQDSAGRLYIADTANHSIRTYFNGYVATFAGIGTASGSLNGERSTATFNTPSGLTFDGAGNLYIADSGNFAIRKIDTSGQVTTLAGFGAIGNIGGPGYQTGFFNPASVIPGPDNTLYVSDSGNNCIYKLYLP